MSVVAVKSQNAVLTGKNDALDLAASWLKRFPPINLETTRLKCI
jgi:hypothetical protein